MKPIIAVHGLQGSGKTFLINTIKKYVLHSQSHLCVDINIKASFAKLVNANVEVYKSMGIKLNDKQMKQLLLSVSTFGETQIDKNIWTDEYIRNVGCWNGYIFTDDIRTDFNIDGLIKISEIRPVVLFKLDVSESVRRDRLGDKYRENAGYTEVLKVKPSNLPSNFTWVELGEDWSLCDIKKFIGA